MDSKTKFSNWRVLLVGAVLGSLVTAGVFVISPAIANKGETLRWAGWTGFGEDTTLSESIETKTVTGKTTVTKQFQSGKTLWDWLGLLAVPLLLLFLSYLFQRRERERADRQAQVERDIANENLRDEALQAYIDSMSELLLDKNLIRSNHNDPLRNVARTRTLTILRRLHGDGERKATVLLFLHDAELLKFTEPVPLINLKNADFSKANLRGVILDEANLAGANLQGAILEKAYLQKADLRRAKLQEANLQDAILYDAKLQGVYLQGANLQGADLRKAVLWKADLMGANLMEADLAGANLMEAENCEPDQIRAAKNWESARLS